MPRERRNGKNPQNLSSAHFGRFARKLNLRPNTILAFNEGCINREGLEELAEAIRDMGVANITLLVVKDVNDMVALSEEDMNKIGWFKVSTLAKMLKSTKEEEQQQEEGEKKEE